MNGTEDKAAAAQAWLARLLAPGGAAVETVPAAGQAMPSPSALAALAAEALACQRSLLLVTRDDGILPDISNALDLNLRPLCLVLPAADYACRIALRATLSLLKSRLARAGGDTEGPIWVQQHRRLRQLSDLWQAGLAWSSRGLDAEPWPADIADLFPVRILPLALARRLSIGADWTVRADGPWEVGAVPTRWPGTLRTLYLGGSSAGTGGLVVADAVSRLRAELDVLTQELSELELELATAQEEIAGFTHRYHSLVGSRLASLDELQAQFAARRAAAEPHDLEAGRDAEAARARAEQSHQESRRWTCENPEAPRPFVPNGDLKKLYRQLAQKIHPDRARDEADRTWRTQLMSEANRAYRAGDAAALAEVLALWREGTRPGAAAETDAERLASQVAAHKRRIADIEGELNRLFGSKLYELFTAAQIARRAGRDLLQEMAARLDADLAAARARLTPVS